MGEPNRDSGRPVRTILVVDDSRTNLNVIGERLTALGYLTALVDNGGEALDLIAGRGFDLVLLDMVMPGMTGVQVLAELRSRTETSDLPVIVVTARSDPEAAIEALAAGADDHLAKPFDFDVLAARIERTLARARRVADLKRSNAALDARIAARAMELGEARAELADVRAERQRLAAELARLRS
ncbi:MAG: response regulator [Sphingomonas sp.]|uniref:response regulator n=1 Tax=Sphingomonas sp. TaxID=28214 RepID=UPI001224DA5A|nr:response regulator [Sphingomonas sp.]THD38248.1 MAG: response regulator [Sphingomonas sp.]